jgi:hypothetical protein
MTLATRLSQYAGVFAAVFTFFTAPAFGQTAARLDISKCYSPLLVTHESHFSETNWEWFYLAMMDEESLKQQKLDAQTAALTPWGYGKGDFGYYNDQRERYFELHNESLKYYQRMASSVSYLPPSWQGTIQKCIQDTLQASAAGLTYFTSEISPEKFSVEIKYKSTETFHLGPYVTSSEIDGGYIMVDGKQQRSLYSGCWTTKMSMTCPNVNSRNEFTVIRDDPNKPVTITLNLSNWEHSTKFTDDFVPKKIKCTPSYVGVPRLNTTLSSVPIRSSEQTIYSGGWEVGVWIARAVAPGKVTLVNNVKFSDPRDMHIMRWTVPDEQNKMQVVAKDMYRVAMTGNPDWQDDVVIVQGTQGGGPAGKTMDIDVEYQVPRMSCEDIDWKMDGKPQQTAAAKSN